MRKLKLDELGRPSIQEYIAQDKIPIYIVLDDVRSAHNVGAVFRSADALGIERIILGGITARPPHREITKTAIGATESVSWEYTGDVLDTLRSYKEQGVGIYAVEQTDDSVSLSAYRYDRSPICLVFGNEVAGVNDSVLSLCDGAIEIQQFGTKHSFNISVCAGIVLWELARQYRR